jgi:tetratricopeptide (TPR) repeat protein
MELFSRAVAYQHFERACEFAAAIRSPHWIHLTAAEFARCLVQFGDLDRAEEMLAPYADEDLKMIAVGHRGIWLARAELLRARGRYEEALEIIDQLGSSAKNTSWASTQAIPFLSLSRARVLIDQGRLDEAGADINAALEGARRVHARPVEWQALAASADRRIAAGRDDEARSQFALAFGIVQQLAQSIDDPALRHMYLIADPVERLRREARSAAF